MNIKILLKLTIIIFGLFGQSITTQANNILHVKIKANDSKYHSYHQVSDRCTTSIVKDSNDFCVIIRYPVHANKLSILKNQIKDTGLSDKDKKKSQDLYNQTIKENSNNFDLLYKIFENNFTEKPFFFLPDSSFKAFKINPSGLFVNHHEIQDASLTCPYNDYYLIINGKDEDQFLFVTKDLAIASDSLPYKKNIIFPAFKKIFNRPGYIATQIKYFNDQLKKLHK